MGESVTTERTRSPPVRPARPEAGIDDGSFSRPSAEYLASMTATGQQHQQADGNRPQEQPSKPDVRTSSDMSAKKSKRKSVRYSVGNGALVAGSERKGSIRNAVRRLFGKKPKDDVPEVPRVEIPRHGYHKSDPVQFTRPQTIHMHPSEAIQQRTISPPLSAPLAGPLSAPFQLQDAPFRHKDQPVRATPNAVEFPKSARLKPLDLGNPFYTRVHGPKRRATLPSLIMADQEAANVASTLRPSDDTRATGASFDGGRRAMPDTEIGIAVTSDAKAKMDKRRSRSANDLRQAMLAAEPFRKRTDEIEYWRQSYASVLVSPTGKPPVYDFPHPPGVPEHPHEDGTPRLPESLPPRPPDFPRELPPAKVYVHSATEGHGSEHAAFERQPSERHASQCHGSEQPVSVYQASDRAPSPPPLRSFSRPLTTPATDAPSALESRVAKLEAHLIDFQRSLSNLTLSNPSAFSPTEPPHSSHRNHTPSILVGSSQSPTGRFEDAGDILEREWGPSSHGSTSGADRPPAPQRAASATLRGAAANANGTFTALYNMLSEERSARRTLEIQVRNLQHEVTRLQLSRGSWGSYTAQNLPQGQRPRTPAESSDGGDRRSASRQEAYNALSSPATVVPPSSYLRAFDGPGGRIVSRFSGDSGEDSEYTGRHRSAGCDSGPRSVPRGSAPHTPGSGTPHEMYRTPVEERNPYRFSEDEMF